MRTSQPPSPEPIRWHTETARNREGTRPQVPILPPLGLYIHIPWCVRKCPYCDFNSHEVNNTIPEERYISALLDDLTSELPTVQGREIETIFIGGGTPSLFSPWAFETLFAGLEQQLCFRSDIEITMEANPGTFEQKRFHGFRSVGINRLSVGVQSFNDICLSELGRIHSGQEAVKAIEMARGAGFDNINLDLMHGLPGQDRAMAMSDLKQAIGLQTEHLSWYQLTLEPNTVFWSKPPQLPQDETLWEIQEQGEQLLADNGFQHYEISAYSRTGRHCRHNRNYWQFGDFIGIGAGAHGKVTDSAQGVIYRNWKTRQPAAYLARQSPTNTRSFEAGRRNLSADELPLEFMINALRLTDGVASKLYQERTGLKLGDLQPKLDELRALRLLVDNRRRIQATTRGALFLNKLLEHFC